MTTEEKVVPLKRSAAEEVRAQLTDIAAKASDKDRADVSKLIKRAEGAAYSSDVVNLSATVCALLFLLHNSHNRPLSAGWSLELSRRMKAGAWKQNSMSAGFYKDGLLEDGQHRLAAAAISGVSWNVVIVFGVEHGSVDTIDGGRRRSGADHALLDGIADPSKKQAIIKTAANYFVRCGDAGAALRSEAEVKSAIEANDALLVQAIEIGEQSRENVATPRLKESITSAISYVMMKFGWPTQVIREKLAFFQQFQGSPDGENDPFFVAIKVLDSGRNRATRGEKITTAKEMAYVIEALDLSVKGIKAVQVSAFKNAVKKTLPNPRYEIEVAHEAAA